MNHEPSLEKPMDLAVLWEAFNAQTSQFASYLAAKDPQVVLRKGLVEEVQELRLETLASDDHLTGEVGDVFFYLSEISNLEGSGIDISPKEPAELFDQNGLRIENQDDETLLSLLRVVDHLNPKNDSLWYDSDGATIAHRDRPDLSSCLSDAFNSLVSFARYHDVDPGIAMSQTIAKLQTRERKPHVIDEMKNKKLMSSRRERVIGELTHTALRQIMMSELVRAE